MPAEVFYAYWDPAATPQLGDLLDAAALVAASSPLPRALDVLLRPDVQTVRPEDALRRGAGVVARLYRAEEDLGQEAQTFLSQGHEVTALPTLGPAGPGLAPPLGGRRVLVTRAVAQAGSLLAALRLRGAEPWLLPALRVAEALDPRPLAAALERIGTYRYALFTSRNAVEYFLAALDRQAVDVRRLSDARLLAVGASTALALRARGLLAEVSRTPTAAGLASQLAGQARPGERALLLGPEPPDPEIAQQLADVGLGVDAVAAYRTVRGVDRQDAEHLRQSARPDAAVFYSPSAVEATVSALAPGYFAAVPVVAIGPTTAAACRALGIGPAAEAASPGQAGVLAALRRVLTPKE